MDWSSEIRLSYDVVDAAYIFNSLVAIEPLGALREATIGMGGEVAWMEWAWKRAVNAAIAIQAQIFETGKSELFMDVTFSYEFLNDPNADLIQRLRHCWNSTADVVVQEWLKDYEDAQQNP